MLQLDVAIQVAPGRLDLAADVAGGAAFMHGHVVLKTGHRGKLFAACDATEILLLAVCCAAAAEGVVGEGRVEVGPRALVVVGVTCTKHIIIVRNGE